ncbi:MAG: hypothetical protein IKY28_01335 [Anaerotignum sp.]|nr:hypothetical protein [Anaerotignum sp.]
MKMKRMVAALLVAVMVLSSNAVALADASTTTDKTVYKSLAANTEIYAVTDKAKSDYPNYGAKWEPTEGVYYGRVARGGQIPGGYGLANMNGMSDESLVSHYYSLNDGYSLEYWSYIYGKALNGSRGLLINLNFSGEGADCKPVMNGTYDAKLIADFQYLNRLSCPVFIRIGGEMNVWSKMASAQDFKGAYNHIAQLARTYAPKAALVFSPNFSAAKGVDMDSFYPNNAYVDWIGTSLYYKKFANNGDTRYDAFYGVGTYGDPMLNIQQIINLAKMHKKPVMITEGGSYSSRNGVDTSAFAAERVEKAYQFLTMVYPQIKAIIYSDTNFGSSGTIYQLDSSYAVNNAYEKATSHNPTLLHSTRGDAKYYTKASALSGSDWSGMMTLAAYTYDSGKPSATWYVDGAARSTVSDYPYNFTLNAGAFAPGKHTVEVKFSNGASKKVTINVGSATATPTEDALYADGVRKTPSIYKIDGSNYFKVRDVAAVLKGTNKQFAVGFDSATSSVTLTSGQPYAMTGSEMKPGKGGAVTAIVSDNSIYVNGQKLNLKAYKINGSNYFKLRDLGQALDFYVGYDNNVKSIIVSGYSGYAN